MRWEPKKYRDKLRLRLKRLSAIRTWQLLVLLLLCAIISATFLRLNNLGMMERRDAVVTADEKGDATQLSTAVNELQRYVTGHMNTDLGGGFYMTKSYERAREAVMNAAADSSNPNSAIYNQASIQCQTERIHYNGGYVKCVIDKVSAVGGQNNPVSTLKLPRSEAYKINFASPLWSFDLAGIFVALCVMIMLIILIRSTGVIVLKLLLKRRYSHVI